MICARTDGRIIRKLRRVWELPSHHFGSEEWTKKVWVACGTDGTQTPLHSQSGGFSNAADANKDEITTGQVIALPLHCAGYTPPSTAHKVLRHSPARPRINAVMMGKKNWQRLSGKLKNQP